MALFKKGNSTLSLSLPPSLVVYSGASSPGVILHSLWPAPGLVGTLSPPNSNSRGISFPPHFLKVRQPRRLRRGRRLRRRRRRWWQGTPLARLFPWLLSCRARGSLASSSSSVSISLNRRRLSVRYSVCGRLPDPSSSPPSSTRVCVCGIFEALCGTHSLSSFALKISSDSVASILQSHQNHLAVAVYFPR